MTEMDWVRTQANMKWILGTFDRLVEALRSAPTDQTKSAMLSIIGEFGSQLRIPNRKRTAKPVPNEHKTLIHQWERSQDRFKRWMRLSRMRSVLTSFHALLNCLQTEPNKENHHVLVELIEKFRAEWLQIANLQDGAEPDLADEYKALILGLWPR
jgi:hypothetical protein